MYRCLDFYELYYYLVKIKNNGIQNKLIMYKLVYEKLY